MKHCGNEKDEILFPCQNAENWNEIEKELADMKFDVPEISEEELVRLHSRVLEKTGLKKKTRSGRTKYLRLCACAAVAVFAVLGAGKAIQTASAKSGNDLFAATNGQSVATDNDKDMLSSTLDGGTDNVFATEPFTGTVNDTTAKQTDFIYCYAAQPDGNSRAEHDGLFYSENDKIALSAQNAVTDGDSLLLAISAYAETAEAFNEDFLLDGAVISVTNFDNGNEYTETVPADNITVYSVSNTEYQIFLKGDFFADAFYEQAEVCVYIFNDLSAESNTSNAYWKLSFNLSPADFTVSYPVSSDSGGAAYDGDIRLDFAEISPYSIYLYGKTDEKSGNEPQSTVTANSSGTVYIELANGDRILPGAVFSAVTEENLLKISFILPSRVDADDIYAVYINGEAFIINA